jgi:hypothetical protein
MTMNEAVDKDASDLGIRKLVVFSGIGASRIAGDEPVDAGVLICILCY